MVYGKQNNLTVYFYKAFVTIKLYGLWKTKQPNSVFL